MKIAIQNQRKERDRLLSLPYIPRQTIYNFDELLKSPNIKLLTGPRRVGKSTQALLMLRGKNFAYLNFDDNELLNKWDEQQAEMLLGEIYPNYEYLLLDEVQNIDGWDVWVNKLYRRGVNLVITGSNAKMLSGEMATVLTGRYLEINMLPFSLAEASQFADRLGNAEKIQDDFLKNGGYPETLLKDLLPKVIYRPFSIPFCTRILSEDIRSETQLT